MNTKYRMLAVLVLGGSVALTGGVFAKPGHAETIRAARHAPLGTAVTFTGTVTVPSGAFDAGFALEQGGAGIYVLDSLGGSYAAGTELSVAGVLVDSAGLLAVEPTSVEPLGPGRRIEPECRRTGSVGERTEGQLLRLHGTMRGPLVDDSPYGYKLDLDDGSGAVQVFLYPGAAVPLTGLVDGADLSVVCFSSQYESEYECDPPAASDVMVR